MPLSALSQTLFAPLAYLINALFLTNDFFAYHLALFRSDWKVFLDDAVVFLVRMSRVVALAWMQSLAPYYD